MNTLNFEHIIGYFHNLKLSSLFRHINTFIVRHPTIFEALTRTGQPFGGKVC